MDFKIKLFKLIKSIYHEIRTTVYRMKFPMQIKETKHKSNYISHVYQCSNL